MKFEEIVKDLSKTIKTADAKSTTPYDSVATVTRVDGDTAWVHIAGGVDETPVKLTIDCKEGDEVQVRVGGGRAWIVGNATAPPTDDTLAIEAKKTAEIANESAETALDTAGTAKDIAEATNQHFWTDGNGVHVSSQSKNATAERNTLWNSLGMLFRKGSNVLLGILTGENPSVAIYDGQGNNDSNVVARFGSDVVLGNVGKSQISLSSDSIRGKGEEGKYFFSFEGGGTNIKTWYKQEIYNGESAGFPTVDGELSYTVPRQNFTRIQINFNYRMYGFFHGDTINFTVGTEETKTVQIESLIFSAHYDGIATISDVKVNSVADDFELRVLVRYYVDGSAPTFSMGESSATGGYAIADGCDTTASGNYSQAHGLNTTAAGTCSLAGGYDTNVSGNYSIGVGQGLIVPNSFCAVFGRFNDYNSAEATWDRVQVGNGSNEQDRENIFSIDYNGVVTANGYKFSLQDVVSNSITLTSGSTTWQTLNAPSNSSYAVYAGYYINGSTNILPYCVRQTDTGVQFALHNMVNSNQTFKVEARFLVWG